MTNPDFRGVNPSSEPENVLPDDPKASFLPRRVLPDDPKAGFLPPSVLPDDPGPFPSSFSSLYIYNIMFARARGLLCIHQVEPDAYHIFADEIISKRQQLIRRGGTARPGDFINIVRFIFKICPSNAEICLIPSIIT